MGSPVSPIVANLYMEQFEEEALRTAQNPPSLWVRYVDDTFVVIEKDNITQFTDHINGQDTNIKFTREEPVEGQLAFLDTLVVVEDDGRIRTKVYRKPTHTDQYLAFDSNHHLQHKRSVVRSLVGRAERIVSNEEDRTSEIKYVHNVLRDNGYRNWMLKPFKPRNPRSNTTTTRTLGGRSFPIPYIQGVAEDLHKIYKQHGINTYYKPFNTIKQQLVHPKDKTSDEKKCGVVYRVCCDNCDKDYIGETSRAFGIRLKEHSKTTGNTTAIGEHLHQTGHTVSQKNCSILSREDKFWRRKVQEAITIRREHPSLNRDTGYHLPPIYGPVLRRDSAAVGSRLTGGVVQQTLQP